MTRWCSHWFETFGWEGEHELIGKELERFTVALLLDRKLLFGVPALLSDFEVFDRNIEIAFWFLKKLKNSTSFWAKPLLEMRWKVVFPRAKTHPRNSCSSPNNIFFKQ